MMWRLAISPSSVSSAMSTTVNGAGVPSGEYPGEVEPERNRLPVVAEDAPECELCFGGVGK